MLQSLGYFTTYGSRINPKNHYIFRYVMSILLIIVFLLFIGLSYYFFSEKDLLVGLFIGLSIICIPFFFLFDNMRYYYIILLIVIMPLIVLFGCLEIDVLFDLKKRNYIIMLICYLIFNIIISLMMMELAARYLTNDIGYVKEKDGILEVYIKKDRIKSDKYYVYNRYVIYMDKDQKVIKVEIPNKDNKENNKIVECNIIYI